MEAKFNITKEDVSNIYDIIFDTTDDDETVIKIKRYIYLLYCEQLVNRIDDEE